MAATKEMGFRVLSWNINGLRSFKTGMKKWLDELTSDIICFQETKITRDMLEEPHAIVEGYTSYFSFSKKRSGYSGVATFCTKSATPTHAQEGLSGLLGNSLANNGGSRESLPGSWKDDELKDLDSEGRTVITQHTLKKENGSEVHISVINVYCPRADPEKPERGTFKIRFYELLRQRASALRATGSHVIVLGDVNTSHKRIDHCDPDESEEFEKRHGRIFLDRFLIPLYKEESHEDNNIDESEQSPKSQICTSKSNNDTRSMVEPPENTAHDNTLEDETEALLDIDCLLTKSTNFQMVDTFRYFHQYQKDAFTCWNTEKNARSTNYGTRIDYIFCDLEFLNLVEESQVLQDVMGSDHCPVCITVVGEITPAAKLPSSCTKYFPEFRGQQQKLSSYFSAAPLSLSQSRIESEKQSSQKGPGQISSKRKSESENVGGCKKICKESKPKQSSLSSFFGTKVKPQPECEKLQTKNNVDKREQELAKENEEILKLVEDYERKSAEKNKSSSGSNKQSWGFLMKGPKPAPLCPGHKEPSVLRTVKKKGPNFNKQFYACARGAGKEGDPNAQCNFFKWLGS